MQELIWRFRNKISYHNLALLSSLPLSRKSKKRAKRIKQIDFVKPTGSVERIKELDEEEKQVLGNRTHLSKQVSDMGAYLGAPKAEEELIVTNGENVNYDALSRSEYC